jgi:hypothetical protein
MLAIQLPAPGGGVELPSAACPFRYDYGKFLVLPGAACLFVDGEPVRPQPGRFYGGWITSELVGPFKGEPSPDTGKPCAALLHRPGISRLCNLIGTGNTELVLSNVAQNPEA